MTFYTQRNGIVLTIGPWEYIKRKDRVGKEGEITWRCRDRKKFHCPAFVKTQNDLFLHGVGNQKHTHLGDPLKPKVHHAQSQMRQAARESSGTTRRVLADTLVGLDENTLMRLPSKRSLEDNIRRIRRKENPEAVNPTTRAFEIPERFETLVLHDSGADDENRILALGDLELARALENEELWLADGTFAVVPTFFFQLYTIHTKVGNSYPPCIYFLLPGKSQEIYGRMLAIVRQLLPNAEPQEILLDFENAAQNAFKLAFPNTDVKGCQFHLSQAVLRKVGQLGLKDRFQNDVDFNLLVKSLTALSFVPEDEVLDRFQELADAFPDDDNSQELLVYFEATYIRGRDLGRNRGHAPARYPPEMWNHSIDALGCAPKTTNAVEGFHTALDSLFLCDHPSMWKLLEGLRKDMAIQKKAWADAQVTNNPSQRKKYKVLAERLGDKVASYEEEDDKLRYLRAVAHILSS